MPVINDHTFSSNTFQLLSLNTSDVILCLLCRLCLANKVNQTIKQIRSKSIAILQYASATRVGYMLTNVTLLHVQY